MGCTASTKTEDQARKQEESTKPGEKEQSLKQGSSILDHEDEGFSYFQNVALFAHNHYREAHGAPPLKLNKALCELAEQLARRMAKSEQIDKSMSETRLFQGQVCGENLYWRADNGLPVVGDDVVKHWYNEGEAYDYNNHGHSDATAHFSQMMWSGCREMGMASATSERGASAVAVYFPPGNIDGQYQDNINPPTAKS